MRFVGHGVERQHNAVDLVHQGLRRRAFEQASMEHIIERPVATLINGISFRVIGGREHSLDSEGVQQLAPYFTYKFSTSIREKPVRRAEVGNYMAEESLTHRVCGVVARGDKDGIPRIAVHKHDEELMSVVGWERSHNVN